MAEDRKKVLKELIRQLDAGASPEKVRERFKQVLGGVTPLEIAAVEEELVKEGVARKEIQRLCDVHLEVFREQLEREKPEITPETPSSILTEEHKVLQQLLEELNVVVGRIQQAKDVGSTGEEMSQLRRVVADLMDAEKHYLREENVLFPILERHGIKEPPAVMWMEHNQLRELKKRLSSLVENYSAMRFQDFKKQLGETAKSLSDTLSSHIFKENHILFPAALQVFTAQEWRDVKEEFDEIGYCSFTPKHLTAVQEVKEVEKPKAEAALMPEGVIQFETGALSKEEAEAILNTLPVEVTFVDKEDTVRYFNKGEGRIFIRTKSVIGRKVQQCHPQQSIHVVNRIVESFKKGEKDVAEFWVTMKNRLIHIRFFAVRNKTGEYLGTLEVVQDITDIKAIEGEKRLLDWKG